MTNAYNTDVLSFQGAQVTPLEPSQLVTNSYFIPLNRSYGIPGVLADSVVYGAFKVVWRVSQVLEYNSPTSSNFWFHQEYEFIVYTIQVSIEDLTRDPIGLIFFSTPRDSELPRNDSSFTKVRTNACP